MYLAMRSIRVHRPRPVRVRELVSRPRNRFLGAVVATGLLGGAVGAAFLGALHLVERALGPERWSTRSHLLVLVAVGLAVAGITRLLGRPTDVELLVDNIHVEGGTRSLRNLRSLIPESLLCVGAGGSLGPESPLVTTTGGLGSWLSLRLGLARSERRVVSIAGMAAGFTVLFGAPLGSTMFALEILHRRGMEYYEALLPSAIGSLCGYAVYVGVTGLGLEPMFRFPTVAEPELATLGWGVVAGVVGAAIAAAFTYLCVGLRRAVAHVPTGLRPAIGGALMGGLAFLTPHALTNGELAMDHLNGTTVVAGTMLVAAGVKLASAAIAVVTGWKGGFIIPLFFVGYCLARAAGPHLPGADEWLLAAALMTAANVGVTKTPIGSTLVVTEMAGMVVLPSTLIAALVSLLLTSGVGLIESQRKRFDPTEADLRPAAPDDGASPDDGRARDDGAAPPATSPEVDGRAAC